MRRYRALSGPANLRRATLLLIAAASLLLSALPARADFVITPTFDSSITGLSNAAAVESVIDSQVGFYEHTFTNNTDVNITFAATNSGLGASQFSLYLVNYSNFRNALALDSSGDLTDTTALANLPNTTNNPVTNESTMLIKSANAKALGFGVPAGSDGTIFLNIGLSDLDGGGYSLAAVADHEMDEVLGLGSTLGLGLGAPFNADPSPEDLFRYDASGARSFSTNACTGAPAAYLSLDGTNRLAQFNNCDDGGDYADWQSSPLPKGLNPEVQDAFGIPGTNPALTNASPEVVALDAIGYNVATVPEPSAFAPALLGFGLLVLFARKRAANR